jgi:hypothetical protein
MLINDILGTIYGYPEEIEIDLIKHFDNNYLCDTRDVSTVINHHIRVIITHYIGFILFNSN